MVGSAAGKDGAAEEVCQRVGKDTAKDLGGIEDGTEVPSPPWSRVEGKS